MIVTIWDAGVGNINICSTTTISVAEYIHFTIALNGEHDSTSYLLILTWSQVTIVSKEERDINY